MKKKELEYRISSLEKQIKELERKERAIQMSALSSLLSNTALREATLLKFLRYMCDHLGIEEPKSDEKI